MKPIKLLTLTTRNYLIIFSILIFLFFAIFYSLIRKEVLRSSDEILYNKMQHGIELFKRNGGKLSPDIVLYSDFSIKPTSKHTLGDTYSDTTLYESVDREWDEFRKLTSYTSIDGKYYRIEIVVPLLETHEIIDGIVQSLIIIFIIIVIVFYGATRYLSRKLWHSFYDTLEQLNQFKVDHPQELVLGSSRVKEFDLLNKSIESLTQRTRNAFQSQKQFIENASHEMQTPLAITQSKLELLIEDPNLTEHQSQLIQTLINSTDRLTRLNKTLQLLSKIENQQFIEQEQLFLKPLIEQTLTYFEEQQENLQIDVKLKIEQNAVITANKMLVDLLLTNLIKNAFFHNQPNGRILIEASSASFTILNTSSADVVDGNKIFNRFYKQSANKESWGLGLAIVKNICTINQWTITYSKKNELHSFEVLF
ncbi:MAG TPA: HAMP domain-containing sensor histidine kinase [Cyclobacteriaceae bacterium]